MKKRTDVSLISFPFLSCMAWYWYGMFIQLVHSKKERKKERINGRFWKREVVSGLCWWTVTVTVSYVCMGFWLLGGCGGGGEWGWWILVCVCV